MPMTVQQRRLVQGLKTAQEKRAFARQLLSGLKPLARRINRAVNPLETQYRLDNAEELYRGRASRLEDLLSKARSRAAELEPTRAAAEKRINRIRAVTSRIIGKTRANNDLPDGQYSSGRANLLGRLRASLPKTEQLTPLTSAGLGDVTRVKGLLGRLGNRQYSHRQKLERLRDRQARGLLFGASGGAAAVGAGAAHGASKLLGGDASEPKTGRP